MTISLEYGRRRGRDPVPHGAGDARLCRISFKTRAQFLGECVTEMWLWNSMGMRTGISGDVMPQIRLRVVGLLAICPKTPLCDVVKPLRTYRQGFDYV